MTNAAVIKAVPLPVTSTFHTPALGRVTVTILAPRLSVYTTPASVGWTIEPSGRRMLMVPLLSVPIEKVASEMVSSTGTGSTNMLPLRLTLACAPR